MLREMSAAYCAQMQRSTDARTPPPYWPGDGSSVDDKFRALARRKKRG